MNMATCKNCFLFGDDKLRLKVGYFDIRRDMFVFFGKRDNEY